MREEERSAQLMGFIFYIIASIDNMSKVHKFQILPPANDGGELPGVGASAGHNLTRRDGGAADDQRRALH